MISAVWVGSGAAARGLPTVLEFGHLRQGHEEASALE
jgi:hypothetical protein